eukprot:m.25230 g.25230  ORF g.25230 m.25230 type:complete len:71 (-) comp37154_c0_seq1:28-240(-)
MSSASPAPQPPAGDDGKQCMQCRVVGTASFAIIGAYMGFEGVRAATRGQRAGFFLLGGVFVSLSVYRATM